MHHSRLLLAGYLLVGACASEVAIQAPKGVSIVAMVNAVEKFTILAAPKTTADVDHYEYKLYECGGDTVPGGGDDTLEATGDSANTSTSFTTVPDGIYYITAEAWEDAGATTSISQGGAVQSSNTVTVASPNVTYSANAALEVTLDLLDGTGETVDNSLTVNDGDPYAGAIGFTP